MFQMNMKLELGHQLNEMAEFLNQRFENLESQRSERGTALSSMKKDFMAINKYPQFLSINKAAAQLFRLDLEKIIGQDMQLE